MINMKVLSNFIRCVDINNTIYNHIKKEGDS